MDDLIKDYAGSGERLTEMGFKGEILNLKLRKVVTNKVPESESAVDYQSWGSIQERSYYCEQ